MLFLQLKQVTSKICPMDKHSRNFFRCILIVLISGAVSSILPLSAVAQVYTNKPVGQKNEHLVDSIKTSEYPYWLPFLGKNAVKKGFVLPLSAGISVNYFWQESAIVIDNLQVGFNNGEMYEVKDLIRFDDATARTNSISVRPDVWVFPFLNVYGIFGRSSASTDVSFGLWIPDSTNTEKEIFSADSKVEFGATTYGFGIMPTFGVAGGWISLDMNFTWTDVPQLNKPASIFVLGPRIGKTFKFRNPERNIAFWVGGFRVRMNSGTSGSVNLADVLPVDGLTTKIEDASQRVTDAQQQVDDWWAGLTPIEQNNPLNAAKYERANSALARAGAVLSSATEVVGTISGSSVQYSMDKSPKDKWNFVVGSQFQLNRHFMVRAEYGFLSSRQQFTTGLQYRFGL